MAVAGRIFGHAVAAPGRGAVTYNGRTLSYGAFAGRIARARRQLAAEAPAADRVAGLCIHHPLQAWIVGLALRSLGLASVNVRSVEDLERLALGPASLVTVAGEAGAWAGLAQAARAGGSRLIVAATDASDAPEPAEIAAVAAAVEAGEARGGHMILTSGTTGIYKKVLMKGGAELAELGRRADFYGLARESVVDMFDFGGWTSLGYNLPACAWALGARVVLHSGPDRWRSLAARDVTLAYTQPQLLADLLAAPAEVDLRNDAMVLVVSAGALTEPMWRAARERLTRDVRTVVGSSETGGYTVTRIETPEDLVWHQIYEPGRVEVVDDADRPTRPGQIGLLRVRSPRTAGYEADAGASAAFFRDGFFYPGDLAILREDGRLSLQGRVTDVINVMGDKIAAGPIEAALRDALGAVEVCVFSAPGADGEAVHVAVQPGGPVSPAGLKAALSAALPPMAAVRVHVVKGFARNHMGKIDRAALKAQLLAPGGEA